MVPVDGYIRVSIDEQAKEGSSLINQREKIAAYCSLYELELQEVYEDAGLSAKGLDRPALQEHLERLRRGVVQGTVIYKLDRLTRSLRDWTYLIDTFYCEKKGKSLFSVNDSVNTTTATGRMILNIIMTIAQWEREIISERTADNLQGKIRRGERVGKLRFGYDLADDGKTLLENATEQEAIRLMTQLRGEGRSLRAIAEALQALGIETKEGNELWLPATINRILQRSA